VIDLRALKKPALILKHVLKLLRVFYLPKLSPETLLYFGKNQDFVALGTNKRWNAIDLKKHFDAAICPVKPNCGLTMTIAPPAAIAG
jgi:hypothetical protein